MSELKNCPRCGTKAFILSLKDNENAVYCGMVDDNKSEYCGIKSPDFKKMEDAIEWWNHRVNEVEIRNKALEEAAVYIVKEHQTACQDFGKQSEMEEHASACASLIRALKTKL